MKLFYENIHVADFATSHSMTVEEMLVQLEFDEQAFIDEHGFDALDYNAFHTLTGVDAEKAHTRRLLTQFDALADDPRQHDEGEGMGDRNSPSFHWYDETGVIIDDLIRLYIRHIATEDWIFNSITLQSDLGDSFETVDGERKMFAELRKWARE